MDNGGYRKLRMWERSMDLAAACCRLACRLPEHERFGLASQIRRCAASIPANIAEGSARRHRGEYVHHLSYARASLAELETHLLLARRLDYLDDNSIHPILLESDQIGRMLTAALHTLRSSSRPSP
jgi:four helix bundle protein